MKSPTLVGLSGGNGLSANADEIMTAYTLYQNTLVARYQEMVVRSFSRILRANGIDTNDFGILPFDPNAGMEKGEESATQTVTDGQNKTETAPPAEQA